MIMTKALVAAWGAVSAAATAPDCENHTYHLPSDWNNGTVWPDPDPLSLEVDSYGNLFLALDGERNGMDHPSVWVCPMHGECKSIGLTWTGPRIVRVHDYPETNLWNVWVVDGQVIKICSWNGGWEDSDLPCGVYNNLFINIRDMMYVEPNLFVVGDKDGRHGVWKCTSNDCDMFQTLECRYCATKLVADFHGNIFFYDHLQFKCAVDGTCSNWTSHGFAGLAEVQAVGPDDSWYMRGYSPAAPGTRYHDLVMKRCPPGWRTDHSCETLGQVDLFDRLRIDRNGALYVNQPQRVWEAPFDHKYHKSLDLHKLCLPSLAKEMQV